MTTTATPADSSKFAEDLVRRIREGEHSAEHELVSRYRGRVMLLLRRTSRDASSWDDLHQQTFHIGLQKIRRGDLREPGKLSRFLRALARNLAIVHFRKAAAEPKQETDETAGSSWDPTPDPLQNLLAAEQEFMVRRVLSEMPNERDREILCRFYLAEEDKDAICRDLGLTSLHFNRVLHRARERYRELYEATSRERR
jgi:RNA polymerase sigma-70 factor (ECF subfamily)